MPSPNNTDATKIWLVDQNPLHLPEPSAAFQTRLYDYDKMLRIMPSQKDRVYRLCRLVRREARLGLLEMVVHKHPDTVAMIKFGVVPVGTLAPWSIHQPEKVIRDLRTRDTWNVEGGDPNKIVDALEAGEQAAKDKQDLDRHAELDEINDSTYRQIRGVQPASVHVRQEPARTPAPATPLPALPALP